MKRIVSILLSVLLMLALSVTAFAEGELIQTEDDATEAAKREIEVWKEMGLLSPEVSLDGDPDSIVLRQLRAQAISESIPEFIRFNIVEKDVRNVC